MHATVQCGICTHMYIYMASLSEQYNYVYTLSLSLSFCFSLSLNFQELFSLLPPSTKKSILMQASGECSAYGDDSYNTTPAPPSLSLSLSLCRGCSYCADQVSCLAGDCSPLSRDYADIWGMSLTTYCYCIVSHFSLENIKFSPLLSLVEFLKFCLNQKKNITIYTPPYVPLVCTPCFFL